VQFFVVQSVSEMYFTFTHVEYADTDFVTEVVGCCSEIPAALFNSNHIVPRCNVFYNIHRDLRETGSFLHMQNISSSITGRVMYSVLFTKACIQVYMEFLQRLLFHSNRNRGLHMMILFTSTTSKMCNNFHHEITPSVFDSADGWKDNYSLRIIFLSEAEFLHALLLA
jgi:hypothetical protein